MTYESLSDNEYMYIRGYEIPEGMTIDDVENVELNTQDGVLGFKLYFKGNIGGELNVTEAYEPQEQLDAIKELEKIFGKEKVYKKMN
jgi:hypothetical protein